MEKQFAHNKKLRECDECEWVLLYPDFDLVLTVPGTSERFSVEKYKESIGRPFSRVNLYMCKLPDYESKKCTAPLHLKSNFVFLWNLLSSLRGGD